jgi:hypothetical protein
MLAIAIAAGAHVAIAAEPFVPPVPRNDAQLDGTRPGAAPAERPLRPFAGWLAVTGCRYTVDGSFIGRVQDDRISGMAAEGSNFNWPIATDGGFGGQIRLNARTDDGRVHQWVRGRIAGDRLVVDVEFGVPGKPDSFCRASDQTLMLGGR